MEIQLGAAAAANFLRRPGTSLAAFRSLFGAEGAQASALGHLERPGLGYAAFDVTVTSAGAKSVQRTAAFVENTLALFDLVVAEGPHRWTLAGSDADLRIESLTPDSSLKARETVFLHTVRNGQPAGVCAVDGGVDLAGLRLGGTVVLFHNEPRMNRSALAFAVEDGPPELQVVIAGVAPGDWQLWRNGWLEESLYARPREGGLCFATRPGRFFLRRLD